MFWNAQRDLFTAYLLTDLQSLVRLATLLGQPSTPYLPPASVLIKQSNIHDPCSPTSLLFRLSSSSSPVSSYWSYIGGLGRAPHTYNSVRSPWSGRGDTRCEKLFPY